LRTAKEVPMSEDQTGKLTLEHRAAEALGIGHESFMALDPKDRLVLTMLLGMNDRITSTDSRLERVEEHQAKHTGPLGETLAEIRDRLEGIETRLGGVETRFEGVETRFEGVETRFEGVETRLEGFEAQVVARFERLETRLEAVETRLEAVETRLEAVEEQVREVRSAVRTFARYMTQDISEFDRRLNDLEKRPS
jgi:archaellum component FlaC